MALMSTPFSGFERAAHAAGTLVRRAFEDAALFAHEARSQHTANRVFDLMEKKKISIYKAWAEIRGLDEEALITAFNIQKGYMAQRPVHLWMTAPHPSRKAFIREILNGNFEPNGEMNAALCETLGILPNLLHHPHDQSPAAAGIVEAAGHFLTQYWTKNRIPRGLIGFVKNEIRKGDQMGARVHSLQKPNNDTRMAYAMYMYRSKFADKQDMKADPDVIASDSRTQLQPINLTIHFWDHAVQTCIKNLKETPQPAAPVATYIVNAAAHAIRIMPPSFNAQELETWHQEEAPLYFSAQANRKYLKELEMINYSRFGVWPKTYPAIA